MTFSDRLRLRVVPSTQLFDSPFKERVAVIHRVTYEEVNYACAVWNGTQGAMTPVPIRHLREIAAADSAGFEGLTIPKTEPDHKALLFGAGLIRTMGRVSSVEEHGFLASDKAVGR